MRTLIVVKFSLLLLAALKCVWASSCPAGKSSLVMEAKRYILAKLELTEAPRNPDNFSIPEGLLDEVKALEEVNKLRPQPTPCAVADILERETTNFSPTEITEYRPRTANLRVPKGTGCTSDTSVDFVKKYRLKFNVSLTFDKLIKAELHMRKFRLSLNQTRKRSSRDRVDVFSFTIDGSVKDGTLQYFNTKFLDANSISGQVIFNTTEAVRSSLEASSPGHTREIILDLDFRCPSNVSLFVPNFQLLKKNAALRITTIKNRNKDKGLQHKRHRRRSDDDSDLEFCSGNKLGCCLRKFKINFQQDLNWTWVIRPREMSFNYCSGLCPLRGISNLHTQFLDRFRTVTRNPTAAGSPCCVPNTYRNQTISTIVRGIFSNIELPFVEATSCSCR